MLLALLFAMIFGSGGESEFISTVPNFKKEVKINISDEARRDSILVLIDGYEGAIKGYKKEKERLQKKVNKVSADRSVRSEEFLFYYDKYYHSRVNLISSLIDYRLMIQQQITEKELMLVIEEAIVSSAEQRRENQIREEETEDNLNEAFREIADILIRNIGDPDRIDKVAKSFLEFERTMYDNLDTYRDTQADRKASLLISNPGWEELEDLYAQSNEIRYKAAEDFAILREAVIVNTNESEWKQINKDLKAFFKL